MAFPRPTAALPRLLMRTVGIDEFLQFDARVDG
jgi:hypothetical protein